MPNDTKSYDRSDLLVCPKKIGSCALKQSDRKSDVHTDCSGYIHSLEFVLVELHLVVSSFTQLYIRCLGQARTRLALPQRNRRGDTAVWSLHKKSSLSRKMLQTGHQIYQFYVLYNIFKSIKDKKGKPNIWWRKWSVWWRSSCVCLSVYLSVSVCLSLSVHHTHMQRDLCGNVVHVSVCLSICLSLSVCLCLSVCPSYSHAAWSVW